MVQPPSFIDPNLPRHVCKLRKAIYGLKQVPRAWYNELRRFLITSGFCNFTADISLFILNCTCFTLYLLVYVDDIIINRNDTTTIQHFIDVLAKWFSLKDLAP